MLEKITLLKLLELAERIEQVVSDPNAKPVLKGRKASNEKSLDDSIKEVAFSEVEKNLIQEHRDFFQSAGYSKMLQLVGEEQSLTNSPSLQNDSKAKFERFFKIAVELRDESKSFPQNEFNDAVNNIYKLCKDNDNSEKIIEKAQNLFKNADSASDRALHDFCLFKLPDNNNWTPQKWYELALKNKKIMKFLGRADAVEQHLGNAPSSYQETLNSLMDISYTRAKDIDSLDESNLSPAINKSDLKKFAELCVLTGIKEKAFNTGLDVLLDPNLKTQDNLPNIIIDGKDVNDVLDNKFSKYYMAKLPVGDPRGLVLGELTNCCQSIGNHAALAAIDGMKNADAGFYAVFEKSQENQIDIEKDRILAQSYAWLGKPTEKGGRALVFDSWERLGRDNNKLLDPFYSKFADVVSEQTKIAQNISNTVQENIINTCRTIVEPIITEEKEGSKKAAKKFDSIEKKHEHISEQIEKDIVKLSAKFNFSSDDKEKIKEVISSACNSTIEAITSKNIEEAKEQATRSQQRLNKNQINDLKNKLAKEFVSEKLTENIDKVVKKELLKPLESYAENLSKNFVMDKVSIGQGGNTPAAIAYQADPTPTKFNGIVPYYDAARQYVILDKDRNIDPYDIETSDKRLWVIISELVDNLPSKEDTIRLQDRDKQIAFIANQLDKIPNIESSNSSGLPLINAIKKKDKEVIDLLLTKNLNVHSIAGNDSPLSMAIGLRNKELVDKLFDKGVSQDLIDQNSNPALFKAIDIGDKEILSKLLNIGINPNVKDHYGKPALFKAIDKGDKELLSMLLDKGANPNPALFKAIDKGDKELLSMLLDKGANPDSALFKAIDKGDKELLSMLLDKGANPNSALIEAIDKGDKELVSMLLDKGVNANSKDQFGNPALIKSIERRDKELVSMLLDKGANPNSKDQFGNPALIEAIDKGDKELVSVLLEKGANPNSTDKFDNPALFKAINEYDEDMANFLVEKGANPNLPDRDKNPALIKAIERRYKELVSVLLEKGANPNSTDKYDNPALIKAIERGDKELVSMLLDKGANLDSKDQFGNPALINAIERSNKEVVSVLLNKGANPDLEDRRGYSSLLVIVLNIALTSKLIEHELDIKMNTRYRTELQNYKEKYSLLLEKGANPNLPDKDGNPALFQAIRNGSIEAVTLLLNTGADVNIVSKDGTFPLSLAASSNDDKMVKLLLEHKADVNLKNTEGKSAIDLTTSLEIKEMLEAAKLKQEQAKEAPTSPKAGKFAEKVKLERGDSPPNSPKARRGSFSEAIKAEKEQKPNNPEQRR
ncbi:MAG: serine/threonine-protein phosphatase 6 regulatory ankyrin repeat subunit A-like [Rickettsiaceae bacterium]|jgi:ankyrin repeat protein|nr:serine/threonine-protein phosphatase 6 regulatory ankyrin repeat subunit A-like [Rickettsiaceae bacterium]